MTDDAIRAAEAIIGNLQRLVVNDSPLFANIDSGQSDWPDSQYSIPIA